MRNIKLTISYDGTNYRGWQIQKNGITVQEVIEKAIQKVFEKKCRLFGAGRTDSGVHAKGQVANFKTVAKISLQKIKAALNANLPEDIVIKKAEEVSLDFHSQFSAKKKKYKYILYNSKSPEPFLSRYSWQVMYKLDLSLMKKEAKILIGKHDFKSFQATDKKDRASVRTIENIVVKKRGKQISIELTGNGFLYNMVRNIVGTLIDIGRGYLASGSMKIILSKKNRSLAGPTAPAKGLFLMKIEY